MKLRNFFLLLLLISAVFTIQNYIYRGRCANSKSCKESLKLDVDNYSQGIFNGIKFYPPVIDLAENVDPKKVLGDQAATGEKHIYVDLATQTLSAYQGETLFMQVPVSTGKWYETPEGEFEIWEKIRSTKMSGGTGADYYYLPNVPYVMFFSGSGISAGRGFSLHGAYWHNNFGHPMSHGCVNMRQVDAQKLYYWAEPESDANYILASDSKPGTKITIYGKAP